MPMLSFSDLQASFAEAERNGENVICPGEALPQMEPASAHPVSTDPAPAVAAKGLFQRINQALKHDTLMTKEEAQAFHASGKWKAMTHAERSSFQIAQKNLCMPFDVFQRSVEQVLGRPVSVHEFGEGRDALRAAIEEKLNPTEPAVQSPAALPVEEAPIAGEKVPSRNGILARQILAGFSLKQIDGETNEYSMQTGFLSKKTACSFVSMPPATLKTANADSAVAAGMVACAIANGWGSIQVAGTDEFKAQIFYHAVQLGIPMTNYTPTPADHDRLAREGLILPDWAGEANQISAAPAATPRAQSSTGMGM